VEYKAVLAAVQLPVGPATNTEQVLTEVPDIERCLALPGGELGVVINFFITKELYFLEPLVMERQRPEKEPKRRRRRIK